MTSSTSTVWIPPNKVGGYPDDAALERPKKTALVGVADGPLPLRVIRLDQSHAETQGGSCPTALVGPPGKPELRHTIRAGEPGFVEAAFSGLPMGEKRHGQT